MEDILLSEVRDGVAAVTLNRPRQMNALSAEVPAEGRQPRSDQ